MTLSPAALIPSLGRGLLSFPLTFCDDADGFNEAAYRAHVAKNSAVAMTRRADQRGPKVVACKGSPPCRCEGQPAGGRRYHSCAIIRRLALADNC